MIWKRKKGKKKKGRINHRSEDTIFKNTPTEPHVNTNSLDTLKTKNADT